MNSDEKTRLLISSLATAVVLAVGYGLYQTFVPSTPPPPPAAAPQAPAQPAEQAAADAPFRIEAEDSVLAGSKGHQATAKADTALYYEWSITGGTIQGTNTSNAITWDAGNANEAVITCKGTTSAGQVSTSTFRVTLRHEGAIARFQASATVITEGSSVKLGWGASNYLKLTLDPGGQDVSNYSGPGYEVKPAKTTTYTLTATNRTGDATHQDLQIKVVPAPEIVSLRSEPVAGSKTAATVIGEFKGGKAELKNGGQVLASGDASPLRFQADGLQEGANLTFTVTNEAGTYVTSSLTFSLHKR
ncbi:MAG TPA: hypothetical protein VN436_11025 [Holophaga sp.]|nr:hypothetical protein [Holophaga sp.]